MCELSDPSGRYAEHRTMKGEEVYFYQGTDFIRDVESETRKELGEFFGCTDVELRPISGQMANEVVFKGMVRFLNRTRPEGQPTRKMRLVMNNDLTKGGHLSSQPMGALFNFVSEDPKTGKESVLNFPVWPDNPYKPDLGKLGELLAEHRPELIIFGKSMFIYPEPVEFVARIVKALAAAAGASCTTWPMSWDSTALSRSPSGKARTSSPAAPTRPSSGPSAESSPGASPRTARSATSGLDVKGRAFPGSTSNHHLGTLVGLLLAAYEMNAFKADYQKQVRANAKAFAKAPQERTASRSRGTRRTASPKPTRSSSGCEAHGPGQEIARRLERNNIVTNYQALPDDETFLDSSGIRLGVQEMTRFGMMEKDFDALAGYMADVVIREPGGPGRGRQVLRSGLSRDEVLPPAEGGGAAGGPDPEERFPAPGLHRKPGREPVEAEPRRPDDEDPGCRLGRARACPGLEDLSESAPREALLRPREPGHDEPSAENVPIRGYGHPKAWRTFAVEQRHRPHRRRSGSSP